MSNPPQTPAGAYPGERLGLPEAGSGSIAGIGRRLIGIGIDWVIALGLAQLINPASPLLPTGTFILHTWLAMLVLGSSVGHALAGMHLRQVTGEAIGVWRPLVRQAALSLVIPALVWDRDHRGGHDILAGTVLRLR